MQNAAGFNGNITANTNINAQNGQVSSPIEQQQKEAQNTSIFNSNQSNVDINKSDSNSQGTGGIGNIFTDGYVMPAGMDNTSIFSGINRGSQYSLYSKKDFTYDVPKLTQEDIANQKAAEGPKRTNPKAYNIDMTPKANPYEAFRNPDMLEDKNSIASSLGNAFANLFGGKKAD